MPSYDLKNVETGEVKEIFVSISKKEEMVKSGEWEQVHLSSASLVTHTGNVVNKTSEGWKDHLKQIKKSAGNRQDNSINI